MKKAMILTSVVFVALAFMAFIPKEKSRVVEPTDTQMSSLAQNNWITKSLTAYEDGEKVGQIILSSNGRFIIRDYTERPTKRVHGNYSISRPMEPGAVADITFNADDGETYHATIAWPIQDNGIQIYFGDLIFK